MRAVYFEEHGDLGVLRHGELPDPVPPAGWVKVRVRATSLNQLDVFSRRGMPGIKIKFPAITGGDAAGEIAELGEGVTALQVGQRVLVDPSYVDFDNGRFDLMGETRPGAMAEYCLARAEQVIPLPPGVEFDDAACLPVAYGTAHRMLFTRGKARPGEKVLVLGASGGVGNACVLLAKRAGCRVVAAAGSDEKCERLRALGADETLNYEREPFDEYIRRTTGSLLRGGGCEIVVNFTGGTTWAPSLKCVKRHGRLLTCGATAGYHPQTDIRYIFMAEMHVIGSTGWDRSDLVSCLGMLERKEWKPPIDRVFPLAEAIEAVRLLEERKFFGKLVIRP
jgi:alcohol dehydrogenase